MKFFSGNSETSPLALIELIQKLRIKDVMSMELITAARSTTLKEIRHMMKEKKISGVPIVEGRRLTGIVTLEDIMNALGGGYIEAPAEEHMSRNMVVLEEDMPLSMAVESFEKYSFNRFPVLNEKKQLTGIISNRDITNKLLMEMNRAVRKLEQSLEAEQEKEGEKEKKPGRTVRRFPTIRHDFNYAGKASTEIKKILKDTGMENRFIRRVSIAAYELEMNQAAHSLGGEIICKIGPSKIQITALDRGPGIPDIDKAMKEGFSTATEWIRSLGFGAGMGLPNIARVSDEFEIKSCPEGTEARAVFNLKSKEEENNDNQGT